jgi:hypothetical protein
MPLSVMLRHVALVRTDVSEECRVGWKLNGTHELLAFADYVNLLGDNIDSMKKKL